MATAMKKNVIRYLNDEEAQVTKAFMKNAAIFGTEEFQKWREYKAIYPKAQMVTKKIKKNPDQKNRRNMTFENMKGFIKTQPNAKALEEEFETVKKRSKIQKSPYQYVLDWFEKKFDGYDELDTFMEEKEVERAAAEKAAAVD